VSASERPSGKLHQILARGTPSSWGSGFDSRRMPLFRRLDSLRRIAAGVHATRKREIRLSA